MKSTLFVALLALAISSSFAVKIKGSCPKIAQPKGPHRHFNEFVGDWKVIGRSEQTVPRTVYNTLEINHLYPGKAVVIEKGSTRDNVVQSLWDKYIEMTVGEFNGRSYYELVSEGYTPYSFTFETSDGQRGKFWMPYYDNPKYEEAVLASCVKIDDSTVDVKAWFVSKTKGASASQEVKDLVKSLTGQELMQICQGNFC
ncbi:uncharacterized protein LOC107359571 isoform X1 [Tetranychus urticae]|uniref:uncharacterized protein LOC107359571 isoform X1 n=1 Tax=Tetranychus urticae TaxID=32264 RepID=UPI0003569841|nr:uncharacterized protein LOC107359571 isoform X1 [Tetranychus urticae]